MAIEIKELVIKATIGNGEPQDSGGSGGGGEGSGQTEAIVKVCVEKVLEILNEKLER
ncbi:MAG: DUF5908 family protein [Bacteroidota bacterium]